ncbi:MAG: cation:proton antiporter [Saccharolobus sp.]|jgi:Kef-type K+ transport system membrane component KefB|uniref:cation:proton antiporter n=1 Tax=Saccharolobus sp. TaxID=2100761 RepID=UPI0028CCE627|nr:cation:proton antiporter [Saccharolobus sp.]MDT7862529.1 cation:proton antiporter [Saccharolobus sp.]
MDQIYVALFDVSLFILIAEAVRSFLVKFNIPGLVGEILAGIAISPYAFGYLINDIAGFPLINIDNYIQFMAEFSIILLIFASGLEHGLAPMKSAGLYGFLGAFFGAFLPFIVSYYIYSPRLGIDSALILGVSMGATSLAAVISIIEEERLKGRSINFIISASAVDDIVDLILLSTVLAILQQKYINPESLSLKIIELIIVWIIILGVSVVVIPRIANKLSDKYIEEFPFVVLFGLTLLMVSLGYSPIISAFVAGVSLANSTKSIKIREISNTLLSIFGSLFFVVTGTEINLRAFSINTLILSLELTAIASIFKWLGILPFALIYLKNFRFASSVAIGMIPRGETGLVVASIGMSANALNQEEFESIVIMSLLTTLIGSIIFKALVKKKWI